MSSGMAVKSSLTIYKIEVFFAFNVPNKRIIDPNTAKTTANPPAVAMSTSASTPSTT